MLSIEPRTGGDDFVEGSEVDDALESDTAVDPQDPPELPVGGDAREDDTHLSLHVGRLGGDETPHGKIVVVLHLP